jgi:uncharacterized protein (DUF1330 family)
MPAYLQAEIDVVDPEAYAEYRSRVPNVIAAYGGRYLVRGGTVIALEGGAGENRRVIVEFPDMERLLAFYNSEDYAPLIPLRQRASRGSIIAVEGV